jgi:hypothetical protein
MEDEEEEEEGQKKSKFTHLAGMQMDMKKKKYTNQLFQAINKSTKGRITSG